MPKILNTFASLPSYNPLNGSTFLHLVLPFKWFNNDIRGMFQWRLGLLNDVSFFSMAFSKDLIVQQAFVIIVMPLIVLVDFWHRCVPSRRGLFYLSTTR
jgi:hypothetical protein